MENKTNPVRRLFRSTKDRVIFGVCGGLGEYFGIDSIIIRIIFILMTLGGGSGILVYLILAFLIPKDDSGNSSNHESHPTAFKEKVEQLASELKTASNNPSKISILGIIIIVLGGFLLLKELFPWKILNMSVFWAILIILLGIIIIRRKKNAPNYSQNEESRPNNKEETTQKPQTASIKDINYSRGGGKFFRLFLGLIVLIFGLGILIQNFNIIPGLNVDFSSFFKLWPVLIIIVGLSLVSRGGWVGSLLSFLITLAVIFFIVITLFRPGGAPVTNTYTFDVPRESGVLRSEVSIKSGASIVAVKGGAKSLAEGSLRSNLTSLKTDSDLENGTEKISIELENVRRFVNNFVNNLDVKLAEDIPLSLSVDSGASSLNLDLSTLNLKDLFVDAGASKLDIIFGDKSDATNVDIEAGVSSVSIILPNGVGAKIESTGGLSGKNFIGFKQTGEHLYESENYNSSAKKINIRIEAGVSSISVNWR